jgi:hypothetical protein
MEIAAEAFERDDMDITAHPRPCRHPPDWPQHAGRIEPGFRG